MTPMKARIVVAGTDAARESLRAWLGREPVLRGRVSLDGPDLVVIASMGQMPPQIVWDAVARAVGQWLAHCQEPVSATVVSPSGRQAEVHGATADAAAVVSAALRAPVEARAPAPLDAPAEALRECRDAFGPPPRYFDQTEINDYLRIPLPGVDGRALRDSLGWQGELRRTGRIVWACLVRADAELFRPGSANHPAELLYSLDPAADGAPHRLRAIARALAPVDLPDERVPDALCGGMTGVRRTTTLMVRRHLPDAVLQDRPVPLLVLPDQTTATMVLPSRYWSPRLLAHWRGEIA